MNAISRIIANDTHALFLTSRECYLLGDCGSDIPAVLCSAALIAFSVSQKGLQTAR